MSMLDEYLMDNFHIFFHLQLAISDNQNNSEANGSNSAAGSRSDSPSVDPELLIKHPLQVLNLCDMTQFKSIFPMFFYNDEKETC